jgi:PBP1b-binding outer membrane lipoprotein LpoB
MLAIMLVFALVMGGCAKKKTTTTKPVEPNKAATTK